MLDQELENTGQFKIAAEKEKISVTLKGASILLVILSVIGPLMAFSNAEKIGRLAAFNTGLLVTGLAGCMLIAAGALRGHLTLYRLHIELASRQERRLAAIEQRLDQMSQVEQRNGEIIGQVLEDDLRSRRQGRD